MDFTDPKVIIVSYIASNVIALIMLWCSWKRPKIARLLFFLLFVWASWANSRSALQSPEQYLDYSAFAYLPIYRNFILGFFKLHTAPIILTIAACQLLIGISMLLKGGVFRIGCLGGIAFFIGIAPLGTGAAFPSSIIAAVGLYLLFRQHKDEYLWKMQ